MKLEGVFTFISMQERESNGKTYYNANIESVDGGLLRLSTNGDVAKVLQKYRKHKGVFNVGTYNNQMYMRLESAELLPEK